jgi:hypothetical protein
MTDFYSTRTTQSWNLPLDQTAVLVETSISFADFGEHHSRAENGASGTENCESRKKIAVINLA